MAGERAYVEQVSHGCKAATESSGHAPAGTYPSSCIARAPPAQKLQLAYHLTSEREQLWMPLLDGSLTLVSLRGTAHLREAWTDFGGVGAGRRACLRKIDKFSQGFTHPQLEHVPDPPRVG